MRSIVSLFILILTLFIQHLPASPKDASPLKTVPTLSEGRYIPADIYSKHFLATHHIVPSDDPFRQALHLHVLGHENLTVPIHFIVSDKSLQSLLKISHPKVSYDTLTQTIYDDPQTNIKFIEPIIVSHFWETYDQQGKSQLSLKLLHPNLKVHYSDNRITLQEVPGQKPWTHLNKGDSFSVSPEQRRTVKKLRDNSLSLLRSMATVEAHASSDPYLTDYRNLTTKGTSPKIIASHLSQKHPLNQRLATLAPSFYMLPDKSTPAVWHPLQALDLQVYDEHADTLQPITNFTAYSDNDYEAIRSAYDNLKGALPSGSSLEEEKALAIALNNAYTTILSTPYRQTANGPLFFPSPFDLKLESFYSSIPWTLLLIIGYSLSIVTLLIAAKLIPPNNSETYSATGLSKLCSISVYIPLFLTFSLHTIALLIRSYILGRPPVSNMTETVLFVPWVSILAGIALTYAYHSKIPLICASAAAAILLLILKLTGLNPPLENVQAVLNSQFWLTIHVLMVVGSYGAFLLAGVLGHIYLLYIFKKSPTPATSRLLSKLTLQSMYLGLALLIPGTILGGVWAAQSWGRFWDWDPKESWAFISCCTYLIIVHAHYFGVMKDYGIAIGSVIGLMVIAFTWYGVNYILGTGLHSYGFGNGGENLFYLYLLIETFFLAINSTVRYIQRPSSEFKTS